MICQGLDRRVESEDLVSPIHSRGARTCNLPDAPAISTDIHSTVSSDINKISIYLWPVECGVESAVECLVKCLLRLWKY
jgi:hypothetical protein